MVALGAVADFADSCKEGAFVLRNKWSRVIAMCADIRGFFVHDKLTPSEAESFASKLVYACSYKFGRCGRWAASAIRARARCHMGTHSLTPALRTALNWWVFFLVEAVPRRVECWCPEAPTLLFTDGACEPSATTCGAVLFSPRRQGPLYFGFKIPAEWCRLWNQCSGDQVVAQSELFPCLVARLTWPELLRGSRLISFLDSNPARFALIKGFSPVVSCSGIVSRLWREEAALGISSWFERVPGPSNVADAVSRLCFAAMLQFSNSESSDPVLPMLSEGIDLPLHPLLEELVLD